MGSHKKAPVAHCEACGAKIVRYRHKINAPLVRALSRLAARGGTGHLKDLGLTHSQRNNFQKLRYWKLVEKAEFEGVWRVTKAGWFFLHGMTAVAERAVSYRGQPEGYEGNALLLRQIDSETWDRREDYWRGAYAKG